MSSLSSSPSSASRDFFQPDLLEHKTLLACLTSQIDERGIPTGSHTELEWKRLCALKIIQNGKEDIHQVVRGETFLHLAVQMRFIDVVELLIEKGININAQDGLGRTALHWSCYKCDEIQMELIPLLLYHGADPWIHDYFKFYGYNLRPLDTIVSRAGCTTFNTTIEHLFRYMFNENQKFDINVRTLLKIALMELPFFYEMVENISVEISNYDCSSACELFKISQEYLQTLIDKCESVLWRLLTIEPVLPFVITTMQIESVDTLFSSCLQPECREWFCQFGNKLIRDILSLEMSVSSKENLIYYLLSYGITASEDDLQVVREKCGYNTLLKLLLHLDLEETSGSEKFDVMTQVLYDVTGFVQTRAKSPVFWTIKTYNCRSPAEFKDIWTALSRYAFPVKGMQYYRPPEHIYNKILDHPRMPLLVELARNVFRRYFVERLKIENAKQFYTLLNALPISAHHKKIITLEVELY